MEKLMLVNEVMHSKIEHNPCETYKTAIATTLDEKGYCIRPYSGYKPGQNITLKEYTDSKGETFAQYIVPSGLYKNVYFEADNFDKQYWEEYEKILEMFVMKLGKGSIAEVFATKEEREEYIKKNDKNASIIEMAKGNIQEETSHKKERSSKSRQSIQSFRSKCSKEDIKDWIDKERIDIDSLPTHLCIMIKEFLDSGQLHIIYKKEEKFTQGEEIKKIKNLKVDVGIPVFKRLLPFLSKKGFDPFQHIRAHIESLQQELKKKELKKEVFIYVHLKHDGIEN